MDGFCRIEEFEYRQRFGGRENLTITHQLDLHKTMEMYPSSRYETEPRYLPEGVSVFLSLNDVAVSVAGNLNRWPQVDFDGNVSLSPHEIGLADMRFELKELGSSVTFFESDTENDSGIDGVRARHRISYLRDVTEE